MTREQIIQMAWMRDDSMIVDTPWGKYGPNKVFDSDAPSTPPHHPASRGLMPQSGGG
jgi:hypothetical protein